MFLWILFVLIALYVIYAILPEGLCKYLHMGTIWRGSSTHRAIALTFDDGPDARYTPEVLRILKEHGAKATFFMVAERAQQHPELVAQVLADGHEVASHNTRHVHTWLQDPVSNWRNVSSSRRILERITGKPLRFHRPPWGAFSIANRWACKWLGLRPVLWSVRAKDWYAGDYADDIVARVVQGAHPGAIVLCHDAGGAEGAPLNTIRALPKILTQLGHLGYAFETVGELADHASKHRDSVRKMFADYPWHRRLFIHLWAIVETTFARLYKIRSVNEMFRISPATWHHGPRVNKETQNLAVTDGDLVLDLHFQNETIITFSTANDNRALVRGLRMAKDGFKDLARILQFDARYSSVKGIMAVTLMNRGMDMLGFHVEDLPDSRQKRRLQRYMQFLMGFYHPEGFRRLKQGRQALELRLIWMTKDELIQRYGELKVNPVLSRVE